jgi:hypothetical protein
MLAWKEHAAIAMENSRARGEARGLLELQNDAETKNAVASMGFFGGILGSLLGTGGGLARRSRLHALLGGGLGFCLGGAIGAAVPSVLVPLFYLSISQPPNLALPLIMHMCMYSAIGSVSGLVLGFGIKGWQGAVKGFVAGAFGAALGALVFNTLHTLLFPLEWDFSPMPGHQASRIAAHLCMALFTVVSAVSILTGERQPVKDRSAPAVVSR